MRTYRSPAIAFTLWAHLHFHPAGAAAYQGSASDSFAYSDGANLQTNTASGGNGFSAAWGSSTSTGVTLTPAASSAIVTGGQAVIDGTSSSALAFRDLGQIVDSGDFYFSYHTALNTLNTGRTTNFAFFGTTDSQKSGEREKIAFGQNSNANAALSTGGNFGINYLNSFSVANSASPVAYNATQSLVVGRITFNASGNLDRVRFYLNPAGTTEPATAYIDDTSVNLGTISALRLFAGGTSTVAGSTSAASVNFDNVRLGSTFASVVGEIIVPVQYSQIWGNNGSTWNRAVLKDWSKVGYRAGEQEIPSWSTGVDVTDHGAVGDGTTDCTAAFNAALAACPANKAVHIPNGNYLISGYVNVSKNNTVLRGESRDGVIIKINTNLTAEYGGDYSFGGGFLRIQGGSEKGIESLTIKFPPTPYAGHFNEIGQNGIDFAGATNCWIRNIRMINVDYGIDGGGTYNSILDTQFDVESGRTANGSTGHHGIDLYGDNNLVRGFRFNCDLLHELSVEANATDNVFSSGSGVNVALDNHSNIGAEDPVRNLYSDIDCGTGNPYTSNATVTEPENSASTGTTMGTVYWNIRSAANQPVAKWLRTVSVGTKTADATAMQWTGAFGNLWTGPLTDYWHEKITPANLSPQDIYSAQLAYRQENPPPVVTFTSLSSVTPPAALPQSTDLSVTVTAVGASSTAISSVDLYLDDHLIARKTAAPYTWNAADSSLLADLPSGSYYFSAIATDALGRIGTEVQRVNINLPSGSGLSSRETHSDERIYQTSRATGPGSYVLTGAGRDFQAYLDEGAILSRTISGTTTLVTRVDSFQNSGGKAGLMFRGTAGRPGGNPMTLLTVNANGTSGLLYQVRATGNGSPTTVKTIPNIAVPVWLRLERNGTTHTASYSTNGTSWTAVESTTVDLGGTIYGSIAFTPRQYRTVSQANFSQTSFGATLATPGMPAVTSGSGQLTLEWSPSWEASSYQVQRATSSGGTYTTIATGVEATTFTDTGLSSGTPYYYKVLGERLGVTGPASGVGSGTATVPLVVTINTPAEGASLVQGNNLTVNASATGGTVSNLKLSVNGVLMHQENTAPYDWSAASDAALGDLSAGLHDLSVTATASGGNTSTATRQIAVGLADGSGLQLTELGPLFEHFTVRNTALAAYSVRAAGTDLWGSSDQGGLVTRPITGDSVAIVKVESLANTNVWAKAGLTFRDGTASNAANVAFILSAANGVSFQVRPTIGAATTYTAFGGITAPVWLRLTRQGNNFTAAFSANGTTWTSAGTKTATVAATAQAGLAVTSHNAALSTTATFSGFRLETVNSLAGWRALTFSPADLSNPAISGDDADPDHDGLTNFHEFVTDLNPHLDDRNLNRVQGATDGLSTFTLQFRQRKDLGGAPRVFQQSTDLSDWPEVVPSSVDVLQDLGNAAIYEARFPLTGEGGFFRVLYPGPTQ
ncbi:Ig-like domain-containing protein [Luteolibacter arcticus]|uniref:Ig-like domain-containing protein n=1 Tax=Luteolibacter arcticus TaxID=1581411 RepID=A0ABT3GQB8_9BACT|nr:glycosyl hydrolase family 28-related protein [Luteolibacter arcticus]MCW1925723.1 Ig-like domain-containing protein [Luteolibacter arcticus]